MSVLASHQQAAASAGSSLECSAFPALAAHHSREPSGADFKQQRATYLCTFPRFPVNPPREGIQDPFSPLSNFSTPRTLPQLPGHDLHSQRAPAVYRSRILPVAQTNYSLNSSPAASQHSRHPSSPPKTTRSRTVFTSAKARPLRLVQESLNRKRRPPVFYAQRSHGVVQSLTYITVHQQVSSSTSTPTTANMATNPIMPKVAPLPSIPSTSSRTGDGGKDRLLADLRRQVNNVPTFLLFLLLLLLRLLLPHSPPFLNR